MRIWESFKFEEKIWVLDSDSVIGKRKVWGRKNEREPKVQEKWAQKKFVFSGYNLLANELQTST